MISPDVQSNVEILPATLKFTDKTQQHKFPGTPKIWGQNPQKTKVG